MGVDRLHQAEGGKAFFNIDMRPHAKGMNPCIGAASAVDQSFFAGGFEYRLFDSPLD